MQFHKLAITEIAISSDEQWLPLSFDEKELFNLKQIYIADQDSGLAVVTIMQV